MSVRLTLMGLGLATLAACDSSGRGASVPTEAPPSPRAVEVPSAVAAEPAPVADATVAAPPAAPQAYPADAVERARRANSGRACQELVYKKGCAETRTGRVKVRLSLAATGKVETVEIVDNGVRRDPDVVEKCLKTKLPEWSFDPPDGAVPTVELELVFADKC